MNKDINNDYYARMFYRIAGSILMVLYLIFGYDYISMLSLYFIMLSLDK